MRTGGMADRTDKLAVQVGVTTGGMADRTDK